MQLSCHVNNFNQQYWLQHLYSPIPVKAHDILNYCGWAGIGVSRTYTLSMYETRRRERKTACSYHNETTHSPRWFFPEAMWSVAMGMVSETHFSCHCAFTILAEEAQSPTKNTVPYLSRMSTAHLGLPKSACPLTQILTFVLLIF